MQAVNLDKYDRERRMSPGVLNISPGYYKACLRVRQQLAGQIHELVLEEIYADLYEERFGEWRPGGMMEETDE